jgi:hypothetical protein
MSALSLRLPDSLHRAARDVAKKDRVSINQFIATAVAEKVSALATEEYLLNRASRAPKRREFERIMAKVPSVTPERSDRL